MAHSHVTNILEDVDFRRNNDTTALTRHKSTKPAGDSLPVELWTNIFYLASAIPGKNEFSTEPQGYYDAFQDPPIQSSRISSRELCTALRTRLFITLICKRWYIIGLRVLYSHFRVQLSVKDAVDRIVHTRFTKGDQIAGYVRRVTVLDDHRSEVVNYTEAKAVSRRMASAVSMLPCLVIISTEWTLYWSIPTRGNSKITIADFSTCGRCVQIDIRGPGGPGWSYLKCLRLKITGSSGNSYCRSEISFPELTTLDVSIGELGWGTEQHIDHSIADYISNSWKTPKLRTFSLYSDNWARWKGFLDSHEENLRVLGIRNYPTTAGEFPTLAFPHLRELYIIPGPKTYYPGSMITAPVIERIALHHWRPKLFPLEGEQSLRRELAGFLTLVLGHWAAESPRRVRGIAYAIEGEKTLMRGLIEERGVLDAMRVLGMKGGEVLVVGQDEVGEFRKLFERATRQASGAFALPI